MKSLKLFSLLAVLVVLAAFVPTASAASAYSVANLQGKYLFQMQGVTNSYGYSSCSGSTCVWTDVPGGASCPVSQNCSSSAFVKFVYGYIEFDGTGKITYVAFVEYHPTGGPGPTTNGGSSYGTYTVQPSGVGSISVHGAMSILNIHIGQIDSTTGIAGSMLVYQISQTGDAGSGENGIAIHQ